MSKTQLEKCIHCGQLILRKISRIGANRCQILRLKCTKCDFCWGSTLPYPLTVFKGPTSKGREGERERGREGERKGKGVGDGREGRRWEGKGGGREGREGNGSMHPLGSSKVGAYEMSKSVYSYKYFYDKCHY